MTTARIQIEIFLQSITRFSKHSWMTKDLHIIYWNTQNKDEIFDNIFIINSNRMCLFHWVHNFFCHMDCFHENKTLRLVLKSISSNILLTDEDINPYISILSSNQKDELTLFPEKKHTQWKLDFIDPKYNEIYFKTKQMQYLRHRMPTFLCTKKAFTRETFSISLDSARNKRLSKLLPIVGPSQRA